MNLHRPSVWQVRGDKRKAGWGYFERVLASFGWRMHHFVQGVLALVLVALLPCGALTAQEGWLQKTGAAGEYLYWVNGVGYSIDRAGSTAAAVTTAEHLSGEVSLPTHLIVTRDAQGELIPVGGASFSVMRVGANAFAGRDKVTRVLLGREVQKLESRAFAECTSLVSVAFQGASEPEAAADAFAGAGVERVERAGAKVVEFTSPTGHGKLVAMLNGRLVKSGVEAEAGELVITATADANYLIATSGRRNGVYTSSDVGVEVDGNAVTNAAAVLSSEGKTVEVRVQLDGTQGTRIEVAFMPCMVRLDFGVLQSEARVFTENNAGSSKLGYVKGGTLSATVDNANVQAGAEVEFGAKVVYKAAPGVETTISLDDFGDPVWAVDVWRVGGEDKEGERGKLFSWPCDGQPVHVRFKRTKFLVRCNQGGQSGHVIFQGVNIYGGDAKWFVSGTTSGFVSRWVSGSSVGVAANGIWVRGKELQLLEDTYVEHFISPHYKPILVKVVTGPGELVVKHGSTELSQRATMAAGWPIRVEAKPEQGAELRSLTLRGVPIAIVDRKRGAAVEATVANDASFRMFATFAEAGKQVVTIAEEGLSAVYVERDGVALRNGDVVKPGDRLLIKSKLVFTEQGTLRYALLSLMVNGAPFTSGDVYVVGKDDVNITAIASNYNKGVSKPSFLTYQVFGPGVLSFGMLGSTSPITPSVGFTPTATPEGDARLVRLTANGKLIQSGAPFKGFSAGEDVYVEAVFAPRDAYVWLLNIIGEGYVEVRRNGERLRPGAEVHEGEQLTVVARASSASGTDGELELLTVNGVPIESGRVYTVPGGQDVAVEATFGSKNTQRILLAQRGRGEVTLQAGGVAKAFPYVASAGELFKVKAKASTGWQLRKLLWGSQPIEDGAENLLAGTGDVTVFAHFAEESQEDKQYLYLPIVPGGRVVVSSDGKLLGSATEVRAGQVLTIEMRPDAGFRAGAVYVNGDWLSGSKYVVPSKGDVEVKAIFRRSDAVTIALVQVGSGLLQATQGGEVLRHGAVIGTRDAGGTVSVPANVAVSAKAGAHQQLVSLTVDGEEVASGASKVERSYTLESSAIKGDVTVKAVFGTEDEQVLSVDIVGNKGGRVEVQNGSGVRFTSGSVVTGETLSFVVRADEGWELEWLKVNGNGHDPASEFHVAAENVRVAAKFRLRKYHLSVAVLPQAGSGEVTVTRAGVKLDEGSEIHFGERVKVAAVGAGGRVVKGISVEGARQVGEGEYEVLRDTRVEVTFGADGRPVLVVSVQPSGEAGRVVVTDAMGQEVEKGAELTRGAQLTVAAVPNQGYRLARMMLNGVEIHVPQTFTVGDAMSVVAYFESENPLPGGRLGLYTSVEGGGQGEIRVMRHGERVYAGVEALEEGDALSISAAALGESRFVSLQVNGVEVSNPLEGYEVRGAVDVKAVFAEKGKYALVISERGPGRVQVERNGKMLWGGDAVSRGDALRITSRPEVEAHTVSLMVDGQEFVSGSTVTVGDRDVRVEGTFARDSHPMVLTLRSTAGGTLQVKRSETVLPQNAELQAGDELSVVALPDEGYRLDLLLVNASEKESGTTYTVLADESVTVDARFARKGKKTLQTIASAGGVLTVEDVSKQRDLRDGAELYEEQNLKIVATAHPGGTVETLKIKGEPQAVTAGAARVESSYKVTSGDETVVVEGSFTSKEYELKAVEYGGDGSGAVVVKRRGVALTPGTAKVRYGDELKIEATSGGDKCVGVWVNDVQMQGESPYLYQVRTGDVTIRALFMKSGSTKIYYTYEVQRLAGAQGTLTVTKNGETTPLAFNAELTVGDVLHIKAKAGAGSYLNALTVNRNPQDVKLEVVDWTVPTVVQGGVVNVSAEFLTSGMRRLDVRFNGPGEVRVTSMDGTSLYANGSMVKEGSTLLVTASPYVGSVCKLLSVNGVLQDLSGAMQEKQTTLDVKNGATVWAEFGSRDTRNLYYSDPVEGEIKVTDVATGQTLPSGAELTIGQKLRVEAMPKVPTQYAVKTLRVNGEVVSQGAEFAVEDRDVVVEVKFSAARRLSVKVEPLALAEDNVRVIDATSGERLGEWVAEGRELKVQVQGVTGYDQQSPQVLINGEERVSYTVAGEAVEVQVVYRLNIYKLTVRAVQAGGGVRVTTADGVEVPLSNGRTGEASVKYGDRLTIEALKVAGYGASLNVQSPLTISGDVEVEVTYTLRQYKLEVVRTGVRGDAGEVLINGNSVESELQVNWGDELRVRAQAKAGQEKVVVEKMQIGDAVYYSGEEQRVRVDGDVRVAVNFGDADGLSLVVSSIPAEGGEVVVRGMRNGAEERLTENDWLVPGETITIDAKGFEVEDREHPGQKLQYELAALKVGETVYGANELPLRYRVKGTTVVEATFAVKGNAAGTLRLVTSMKGSGKGRVEVQRDGVALRSGESLRPNDRLVVTASPTGADELLSLYVAGAERKSPAEYTVTGKEQDGEVLVEATFVKAGALGFSVGVVPASKGRVEVRRGGRSLPHDAELAAGETLTIESYPAPGYVCTRLVVDGYPFVSGDAYTVEHSFKVYAEFGEVGKQHLLIDCGPNGTLRVVRDGEEVRSSSEVKKDEVLTITASPAHDYELSRLTVNGEEKQGNPVVYTVESESIMVSARFRTTRPGMKSVEIHTVAGGRVEVRSADGTVYRDGDEVAVGTQLTVRAKANVGYKLGELIVNGVAGGADGSVEYSVKDGDTEVLINATFDREEYRLEVVLLGDAKDEGRVSVRGNGEEITKPLSEVRVHRGDELEFIPSSGNPDVEWIGVSVNGRMLREVPYKYAVDAEDVRAVVIFTNRMREPRPVYLYTDVTGGRGTLEINGGRTKALEHGAAVDVLSEKTLTVIARPEKGYRLVRLAVNGESVESGVVWQIPGDAVKIEVAAQFAQADMYQLTIEQVGTGVVTVSQRQNANAIYESGDWLQVGTELTVRAVTAGTNEVKALLINGALVQGEGKSVQKDVVMPEGTLGVRAVFGPVDEYRLIVACGAEGKVTVVDEDGSELQDMSKLTRGQKLRVTAKAILAGYGLRKLAVNGAEKSDGVEVTVEGNVVVMAEFARVYKLGVEVAPVELASHVEVKDASKGVVLSDGADVFLGEGLMVAVGDVQGFRKEMKVEGADEDADGSWVVKGDVKVQVVYTRMLGEVTVRVKDKSGEPVLGATVTIPGYNVREEGDGRYVVALPDGQYTVTVKKSGYADGEGSVTVAEGKAQEVSLVLVPVASVAESVQLARVELAPNPASVVLRLLHVESAIGYVVYSQQGVEVMRGALTGEMTVGLDVSKLPEGVYVVRVEAADGWRALRFVVRR